MIRIDGSYGEGGGQILRTALALSAVLQQPFEIFNIRKGRKKPGLLPQHLTCVNAAAQITAATIEGNSLGSLRLVFEPSSITGGSYKFNVASERGSAGSVTLVSQTVLPILFFANHQSQVTIKGGTHVPSSPTFDYLREVLLPTIAQLGFTADASIRTYGFYPIGGGEIVIKISPRIARARERLQWTERGAIQQLSLVSAVSRLDSSIAKRQKLRFLTRLNQKCAHREIAVDAASAGTYLFFKCQSESGIAGFSSLGARGKPAEKVADEAYEEFEHYRARPGLLEPYLADQVLIFLALRRLQAVLSTTKITDHLLTTIWVIRQFLKECEITLKGSIGEPGQIDCIDTEP